MFIHKSHITRPLHTDVSEFCALLSILQYLIFHHSVFLKNPHNIALAAHLLMSQIQGANNDL